MKNWSSTYAYALLAACLIGGACSDDTSGTKPTTQDAKPTASVAADVTLGTAPLMVAFTGNAVGGDEPIAFAWSFGDGESSSEQSPSHEFTESGTYNVTLVVTDADGDVASDALEIHVASDNEPAVEITASRTSGLAPLDVEFVGNAVGGDEPITYAWDFDGDGATDSVSASTRNTFQDGTYTVSLTVTDADGDTATDTVEITAGSNTAPTVTATASVSMGLAPLEIDFVCNVSGGDAPVRVRWDFGEGSASELENPSHTYLQPGTYSPTCTATDATGDSASASVDIVVGAAATPMIAPTANPSVGVAPLDVTFLANAVGGNGTLTYAWDFGDGTTDATADPTHTFTAPGLYQVSLVVTDADGDAISSTLTIDALDGVPSAVAAVQSPCAVPGQTLVVLDATGSSDPEGQQLAYEWDFVSLPPGSSVQLNNDGVSTPSFIPDLPGLYELRVWVDDGTHRVASNVVSITSDPDAGAINVVAAEMVSVPVDTLFTVDPVVEIVNSCGTVIDGKLVTWRGFGLNPTPSSTITDAAGESSVGLRAGTQAGPVSLEVEADGVIATLNFTLDPGPPAFVTMQPVADRVVSDASEATLFFTVTDAFGNANTATDVTFDLNLPLFGELGATAGSACGSSATSLTGITTTGGQASAYLCSTQSGDVEVQINAVTMGLSGLGLYEITDDLEAANPFVPMGAWEYGAPTTGPGAAYSGTNAIGTVLDADYVVGTTYSTRYPIAPIALPFALRRTILQLRHWFDAGDTDGNGCWDAGARVRFNTSTTVPSAGYTSGCTAIGNGFAGSSGGWILSTFEQGFLPNRFEFSFASGPTFPMAMPQPAPGWFIDDIVIQYEMFGGGLVRFTPDVPAMIVPQTTSLGSACGNGSVLVDVTDQFGNPTGPGTQLDLSVDSGAEIVALILGQNFGGVGAATTAETDANSQIRVEIDPLGTNTDVTLSITDSNNAATTASIVAGSTLVDELGWCSDGVDNDCDGLTDCASAECNPLMICQQPVWTFRGVGNSTYSSTTTWATIAVIPPAATGLAIGVWATENQAINVSGDMGNYTMTFGATSCTASVAPWTTREGGCLWIPDLTTSFLYDGNYPFATIVECELRYNPTTRAVEFQDTSTSEDCAYAVYSLGPP